MTNEELMKPRYKVIADYPNSVFDDNQIICLGEMKYGQLSYGIAHDDGMEYFHAQFFIDYPHLFKRLEWWEERTLEEMPKYVKSERFGVCQITKYDFETNTIFWDNKPLSLMPFLQYKIPATEAEYLSQSK